MPTSLSAIAAALERVPVQLPGGRVLSMRAITEAEADAIDACLPRPVAPYAKDPTRGSSAPPIVDENDPEYQRRAREWDRQARLAEIAGACDLELADGRTFSRCMADHTLAAYLRDALKSMAASLTYGDVEMLYAACVRAAQGLLGRAEGNSSANAGTGRPEAASTTSPTTT